jgi:type IV pilus assembly protein PilB
MSRVKGDVQLVDSLSVKQLGDILVEDGLLTHEQLVSATAERTRLGRSLGRVLVDLDMVTEAQLVAALAAQIGMQFVDLGDYPVDGSAVAAFPDSVARRYTALGIGYEDGRIVVAMADPANIVALDDIRSLTGRDVKPVIGTRGDITAAINRFHRVDGDLDDLTVTLDNAAPDDEDLSAAREAVDDAPIVKFVNLLITQAVQDRASDIHIEPTERDVRVRYRIDGVLHEIMRSPRTIHSGVVSRLKIMAEMNIAERRVPQDGRLSVNINGKKIDLRLATLPTVWGEKVVMRILDNSTAMLTLADLGFAPPAYERYARSFSKPYGMILVTGPTGSGKSTTLYATLNIVSTSEKNVITVEDPVEYRIPGINQVQVNTKAGLNFASALRSILRSDPDVVLIGEVRDHETAQIAIEASLTGHLVLTTLHTNDAPSAVSRLIEMGIEPFLVGSSLDCVLAQRLARRLCSKCKAAYTPTPEVLLSAGYPWQDGEPLPSLFRAVGCSNCSKTGYKGRLALQEVMVVSEQIERLAVERAPGEILARTAREEGMTTLRSDGLSKVGAGVTSLEEILRVVV